MRSAARPLAPVAVAPAASAAASLAIARRALLPLARRSVLGALDQRLRLNEVAVLVLRDQLEADPAPLLVDLEHLDVEHVATGDHVLDVRDPPGANVRDV